MPTSPHSPIRLLTPLALTAAFGLMSSVPASAQNLVINPGFETGDLTGYTLGGNSAQYVGVGTGIGRSSTYALDIGNSSPDATLTQGIPTTAGEAYTISYYLKSPDVSSGAPGTIYDHFESLFGTTTLFDQDNVPAAALPVPYTYPATFTFYSFTATAQGSTTPLQFSAFNDPSFFILDDISVTPAVTAAVPEPSALALLGVGVIGLASLARKRRCI